MGKAGKTILWFLGACLVFSQGIISAAAKFFVDVDGAWVLLFGFLCLATVLGTLLLMFKLNPAFIIAESKDVVRLSTIQGITKGVNSQTVKYLIENLPAEAWTSGVVDAEEEHDIDEIEPEITEDNVDELDTDDVSDREDFVKTFTDMFNS